MDMDMDMDMHHMHHMDHMNMDHSHMDGHMEHEGMHHGDSTDASHAAASAAQGTSPTVVVKSGYSPSTVEAKAGQPVRLVFDRQEDGECSSHVLFKELNVDQELPAFEKTTLDLGTLAPGEYPFVCGMNMLHGLLKVS